MYIGEIFISLKPSIYDPQGDATLKSLHKLGMNKAKDLRIGKYIRLEIEEDEEEKAKALIEEACKKLLVNPTIETYTYKLKKI